jgi:hypothetical protein
MAKNKPIYVLETGSMHREDQGAITLVKGDLINNWTGGKLYTVDISKSNLEKCESLTKEFSGAIEYVHSDSVSYINKIATTQGGDFDLLYLDSYDLDLENPLPSSEHHLEELKAVYNYLKSDVIIAVDDNYNPNMHIDWLYISHRSGEPISKKRIQTGSEGIGKAQKINPFLISNGWKRRSEFDSTGANIVYCYERKL